MKPLRLVIGVVVIALALWIIVGEQMSGASANATLNAPVVTLRSETAGRLSLEDRALGSRVSEGETLASVEDTLVDRVRLDDLVLEAGFAAAATAQAEAELAGLRDLLTELERRSDTYREARLAELQTRLDHARARLALLEEGDAPETAEAQALLDAAGREGEARIPGAPVLRPLSLEHAQERVRMLEIALEAAQSGVWLGDGYNDAPVSEQKAYEMRSQIVALEARLAERQAREATVAERLDRERVGVNTFTGGALASPVDGLLWEILQADGVTVQRGDPILRLVDCAQSFVTLSVTERIYNGLTLGQPATVRLAGMDEVHTGTVARLAGAGAATVYNHLAVAPSLEHLERYDVAIDVPALRDDPELACAIGRTGRVFFERRPLDWLRP